MNINGPSRSQITTTKKCPNCNHKIYLIIDIEIKATQVRAMQSEYLPGGDDDMGPENLRDDWPHAIPVPGGAWLTSQSSLPKTEADFNVGRLKMTFDEWWEDHFEQIQSLRFQPNPEFVKVLFLNAYEFGKYAVKYASQQADSADGKGEPVLEGVDYVVNQVDAETISLTRR